MTRAALEVLQGGGGDQARSLLRDLYSRYGGSVFGRCQYLLKERTAAEDAMQEVFAKALTHLAEFRSEASPLTWLLKIATHHCLNLLRAEKAAWRGEHQREEAGRSPGHGGPAVLEARDAVRKRFDQETQAAVIHYHLDEMTLEEVAATLGRSVPTIRKRLRQFAAAVQEEL